MFVVDDIFQSEYTKDKSLFVSYLLPFAKHHEFLPSLKIKHKKASHFVCAWRVFDEYSHIEEYSTDDKEPRGSSGIPVLNVMRGWKVVNSSIIVVRYFGGKLLGVGGLVRAYSQSASNVISIATLIPFHNVINKTIKIPINKLGLAKYLAQKLGVRLLNFDFVQNFVIIHIEAVEDVLPDFMSGLHERLRF